MTTDANSAYWIVTFDDQGVELRRLCLEYYENTCQAIWWLGSEPVSIWYDSLTVAFEQLIDDFRYDKHSIIRPGSDETEAANLVRFQFQSGESEDLCETEG
jgi:hypothetical protein